MNYFKIRSLLFVWHICWLCIHPLEAMQDEVLYTIEQSPTHLNRLLVHVDLPHNLPGTRLLLRQVQGVRSQVENITGNDSPLKSLKEEEPGIWAVPPKCRKLQWEVSLLEGPEIDPSAQQSIRAEDFILISEVSSLPRLENETKLPRLRIVLGKLRTLYPESSPEGLIVLPSLSERPLFILINPTKIHSHSQDLLNLTYLQDKKGVTLLLPDIGLCLKGLKWLASLISEHKKVNFTVGWCGISAKKMNITGAAGHGILLVNYPLEEKLPLHNATLLYVPFHEAFHQLSDNGFKRPAWLEESLASYYGSRALQVAMEDNQEASQLIARFQERGKQFNEGLLILNLEVKQGENKNYGAFYTKGISFWVAVNADLQKQNDSLDNHLSELLKMTYDENEKPVGIEDILCISKERWENLSKTFLE